MAQVEGNELQHQLYSAQEQYLAYVRQSDQVNQQFQQTNYSQKHMEATLKAIGEIPESSIYRNIGKAYFLSDRTLLVESYNKGIEKAKSDIQILTNTKNYVEKKQQEAEKKLAEVITTIQKEGSKK